MKNVSKFKTKIEAGKSYDVLKEFIADLDEDDKSEFESNLKKFSEDGKNMADIANAGKNKGALDILKDYGIFPENPKNSSDPLIEELPDASRLLPEGAPLVLGASIPFVDLPSDLNSTINNHLENPSKPSEPNKDPKNTQGELVVHVPNSDALPAPVPVIAEGEEDKGLAIVLQNIANEGNTLQNLNLSQHIESIGNVENIDNIESLDIADIKKEVALYDKSRDDYIKNLEEIHSKHEVTMQDAMENTKQQTAQMLNDINSKMHETDFDTIIERSIKAIGMGSRVINDEFKKKAESSKIIRQEYLASVEDNSRAIEQKVKDWKKNSEVIFQTSYERTMKVFEGKKLMFETKIQASVDFEKKSIEAKMLQVQAYEDTKLKQFAILDKKHADEIARIEKKAKSALEMAKAVADAKLKHEIEKSKAEHDQEMRKNKVLEDVKRIQLDEDRKRQKMQMEKDENDLKIASSKKEMELAQEQYRNYVAIYEKEVEEANNVLRNKKGYTRSERPPKIECINGKYIVTPGSVTYSAR